MKRSSWLAVPLCLVPVVLTALVVGIPTAAPDVGAPLSGSGNPNVDSAVGDGGAQLFVCNDPLVFVDTNFALRARVDATENGFAGTGTFSVSFSESQAEVCAPPNGGSWTAKITCLKVGGDGPGTAQATFVVTRAAGSLSGYEGFEGRVDVFDSGLSGGTGDRIAIRPLVERCAFAFPLYDAHHPVDRGDIVVYQAP